MTATTKKELLLLLVAALGCPGVVYCFVIPSNNNVGKKLLPPTRCDFVLTKAVLSPSTTVVTSTSIKQTSDELLRLLKLKAAAAPKEGDVLNNQINPLVETLISSKSSFNPSSCIDGPLFASIHFIGNTPLWEKIGSGAVRNVKGQKYNLNDKTFTNYAEIWGDNLCLKAIGQFSEIGSVQSSSLDSTASDDDKNLFSAFTSFFGPSRRSCLLPTPYDYEARVTGASISLWNRFVLNLSIEGTGTVRVLYADENLRIFLSPTDTNVTKGAGDWESEGLIVVQVRIGLVYDDWVDKL